MRMINYFGAATLAGMLAFAAPAMAQATDPAMAPAAGTDAGAMPAQPMMMKKHPMHHRMMHHHKKMMYHKKMMMHHKMMMHKKMM